jgi:hypothetical protein
MQNILLLLSSYMHMRTSCWTQECPLNTEVQSCFDIWNIIS